MVISAAETPHQQWTANGTTTVFNVTGFDVLDLSYIDVYVWDLAATSVTQSRRHVDYVISGTLAAPVITFGTAPANTYIVTAHRNTPVRQRTDYQANVPFLMDTHERPLDRLTHIFAELNFQLGRTASHDPGILSITNSRYPIAGNYRHDIFPAAITGAGSGSPKTYPFAEVRWDEAGLQWLTKSGGHSGTAIEFNGCATVGQWRIVVMHELRLLAVDNNLEFRFPHPGPCTSYQCCFGMGGFPEPGGPSQDGSGGTLGTGSPTADPTATSGETISVPGDPNWVPVRRCGDDTATGEYVKSTNIPVVGTFFLKDGECLYLNPFDTGTLNQATAPGTEIATAQTSVTSCSDADCGIPASCPCDQTNWDTWIASTHTCATDQNFVKRYKISGYANTFFTTSTCSCTAETGDPHWNGEFTAQDGETPCHWLADITAQDSHQTNGKTTTLDTRVQRTDGTKWEVIIGCGLPLSTDTIWKGEKTYGGTPAGRYTRTAGCDSKATIDIIEG